MLAARSQLPTSTHTSRRRVVQVNASSQRQSTLPRRIAVCVLQIGLGSTLCFASLSNAADTPELFGRNCAGCHAGGGNIVQRSAGLNKQDLERNNAASPEQIYSLIYAGKGKMPGYGIDCAPKGKCTFGPRLSDDQVSQLTQYVLEKAADGWKT